MDVVVTNHIAATRNKITCFSYSVQKVCTTIQVYFCGVKFVV